MATQINYKLNRMERLLPEGLIVDSGWMTNQGYSTALRSQYVAAGWLKQPARRVYQRPRGDLSWRPIVISLQTLLGHNLVVGGGTALELQGYEHYLKKSTSMVYLYGPKAPPTWLSNLDCGITFSYRNDAKLFTAARASAAPHNLDPPPTSDTGRPVGVTARPWGQWNWPLVMTTPERAILELLDELPDRDSFQQVDMVMEGLATLSPTRLQTLLTDCHNVKVKRLFFYFADRHQHAWLKRLDRNKIDLGSGKRMLVRSGRYEPKYLITVPGNLDGDQ
jgi:Transcriptional regulator, AbiEi antitoxin, Type IV TA system/Transcriptional regulator, AbiEi antitoxin N-terminal domain